MTVTARRVLVILGLLAVGVGIVLTYVFAPLPNQGARDAAAALAIIGAASVGIERLIEMGWTALGSFLGDWWPLSVVKQQVEALENDLDPIVDKFYADASNALDLVSAAGKLTAEELTNAKAEIGAQRSSLTTQLDALRGMAPDSQRAQLLYVATRQKVDVIASKYSDFSDDVVRAVNEAQQSITALGDFVATFKDNPGKRLISIWAGMLLGLGAAGFLGLDVFVAVLGPDGVAVTPRPDPIGIVATGLIIGLGSGPTHEVIKVLQEIKKSRATGNQPSAG